MERTLTSADIRDLIKKISQKVDIVADAAIATLKRLEEGSLKQAERFTDAAVQAANSASEAVKPANLFSHFIDYAFSYFKSKPKAGEVNPPSEAPKTRLNSPFEPYYENVDIDWWFNFMEWVFTSIIFSLLLYIFYKVLKNNK